MEKFMVRLCVKELAQARGMSLSKIQLAAQLPMSTARRYWHGSRTGLAKDAGTLSEVNLATLGLIAATLDVRPGDLLTEC